MARKCVSRVSRYAPFLPSKQAHALSPLGANFQPPFFCFDGHVLTLNLSGNKTIGEVRTNTRISTPKFINFHAEVLHLCTETIVTSDAQFRRGALFPLFWVVLAGLSDWQYCE